MTPGKEAVYLCNGAVAMALLVSASCAAPVRCQGVVGQQGCCYSSVSARRGVAVCRDAQRVVAVGQRSRERSHEVQVANDVASAKELPSCEARPGRRVNNSAAGKLQGGELREDCVEGALERGLAGREHGVRGV